MGGNSERYPRIEVFWPGGKLAGSITLYTQYSRMHVVFKLFDCSGSHHRDRMLPAAARSRPLGRLAAPCLLESVEIEMVAAFPLIRGRSVFIRSPRDSSAAAAAATLGGVVMRLGRYPYHKRQLVGRVS